MAFTKLARVEDVPPGKALQVMVANRKLAVFNVGGTFHVIDDTCPHRGGPLSEGEIEGNQVVCPWHAARFDVTTGAHLCPPANRGVTHYSVQVIGDEVEAEIGPP